MTCVIFQVYPHVGPLVGTAKKELMFFSGSFGLMLWLIGTIFVARGSQRGKDDVNRGGARLKADFVAGKDPVSIWMFPEGTRHTARDGQFMPFKKGAFHLAVNNQLPILPIVISQFDFLRPRDKVFTGGQAVIKVLPAIEIDGFLPDENQNGEDGDNAHANAVNKVCQHTRNVMVEGFDELMKRN